MTKGDNKMTKIIITGGAGFIGSHFAKYIQKHYPKWEIAVIDCLSYAGDRRNLEGVKHQFFNMSICQYPELVSVIRDADYIVNFAAESHVDNSIKDCDPFIETNIRGVKNLLNCCRFLRDRSDRYKLKKFIQISTDETYGSRQKYLIDEGGRQILNPNFHAKETEILRPGNAYSATKAAADMICSAYLNTWGLPIIIVRPVNNYGSHQFPEKFIPATIRRIIKGKPALIYDTGEEERDWLFVEDCCEAVDLVLQKGEIGQIYNIGAQEHHTNNQIVKHMFANLNKEERIIYRPNARPGHDRSYAVDCGKIERLGWRKRHNFDDMFPRVVDWYAKKFRTLAK